MPLLEHDIDFPNDEDIIDDESDSGWEEVENAVKRLAALSKERMSQTYDDSSLPTVCAICKEPFCDPVETSCKHYFCSECADNQHLNHRKCFECGEPTIGLFMRADNVAMKMNKIDLSKPPKIIRKRALDKVEGSRKAAFDSWWKAAKKKKVEIIDDDDEVCSTNSLVIQD